MTLTIDLPADLQTKLSAEAAREGRTLGDYILKVLGRAVQAQEAAGQRAEHSVLRLARQVRDSVPAEAWAELPSDLSVNLDHYLYGRAKENGGQAACGADA